MDAMSAYYSSENVAKACGLLCLKLDGEESCRAKHRKRLDVLQAMCGVMQDMPPERQLVLTIVCHHNVIRKIEDVKCEKTARREQISELTKLLQKNDISEEINRP